MAPLDSDSPHVPEVEPQPRRSWLRRWWENVIWWYGHQWSKIRPGPEAHRGAIWGTLAAAFCCVFIAGLYLRTGFGHAFDFAFAAVFAAVVIPLVALLVALVLTIARHLPRKTTGFIIGACVIVAMTWFPPDLGLPAAICIGLIEGFLGAAIATLLSGNLREAALSKKIITVSLLVVGVAGNIALVWLLVHQGSTENLTKWRPPAEAMPPKIAAPNPADPGPHAVHLLFYGSGTDIRRPEFGKSVAIQTRTVDASDFFKDFEGWKRWTRKKYWGFDIDKMPLNARVWYPEGAGPFPLVLIVHGNHNMAEFSDPGYEYLGELLASRGFILASVDENFINSGLFHDPPKQQAVRGWLLLEHLKLWREWNETKGNPFQGKVDLTRIALMGHSRGGEAAATAAAFNKMKYCPENANIKFDYGFDIKAVAAIAPADGQYKPAGQQRRIEDVSYFTLQGAHDADVSSFVGSRQWDFVKYKHPGDWFKAELYAYRANHGQFNTVWGRSDAGEPLSWLLNLAPLMPGPEQRRISKTYLSAFLEVTLNGRREYLPLFEDWRTGRDWLPDTIYVSRFRDATFETLVAFDDDADLTTASLQGGTIASENLSIWREGRIPWREGDRGYNGVFLGWNREKGAPVPTWSIALPEDAAAKWHLGPKSTLEFSIAAMDEDAPLPGKKKDDKKKDEKKEDSTKKERESPNFTIELVTADGVTASAPASRFAAIPPPLKETFTKLPPMESKAYEKDWEPVFQTLRAPLAAFQAPPNFDPSKLKLVRLKFDRTPSYVICISSIGFGAPGPLTGQTPAAPAK
jgi:dienelactone hydrolase